ncbi:hypothetical protein WG886_002200 [Yersinia enterocolitica]
MNNIEELKSKKPENLKSRSSVSADYVTDDNTGGYFVVECGNCGEVFPSQKLDGGDAIADSGDYGDAYCPHCNETDPDECANVGLVWNVQQAKINALIAQLEAAQKLNPLSVNVSELEATYIGDIRLHMAALYSWKLRAETAEAALSAVQLDATRWRALLSSPAIRILGHAGLQDDKPIDGHYCHFGMEIWSHYEPYYDNKKAGELITRYADNMIAASLVEGNADAE